jgi:penicillin-binding protein 2
MRLVKSNVRDYPYGTMAAHVLGHVGEVTEPQLKQRAYSGLVAGDKVGQAGVEAAFDRYLRGTPGLDRLRVDSLGQPRGDILPLKVATPGNDVELTIDADLQFAAERALQHGIQIARNSECYGCWNANGGAIVAMDARNGEVLAMASSPTFDPRVFVGKPNPWRLKPCSTRSPRAPQLSRARPRARRRLSGRLDVQARDRARRARGLPRLAVRGAAVHAELHVRRRERRSRTCSRTGTRT